MSEIGDWPLALCDGRTVDHDADLVETDHIQRKYTGPTMYMMHNPNQRFYYFGGQRDDEVLIFKNFDSKEDACPCKSGPAPKGGRDNAPYPEL